MGEVMTELKGKRVRIPIEPRVDAEAAVRRLIGGRIWRSALWLSFGRLAGLLILNPSNGNLLERRPVHLRRVPG
jgi:hypothetical protein